jgi:hypothetical protein
MLCWKLQPSHSKLIRISLQTLHGMQPDIDKCVFCW